MTINQIENQRLFLVDIAWYNLLIRISLLISLPYFWIFQNDIFWLFCLLIIPIYGFTLAWFQWFYTKFRKDFKTYFIAQIIHKNHQGRYSHINFIPQEMFDKSEIFLTKYTSYLGEDLINFDDFGDLKLSELEVSKTETTRDSNGNTLTETTTYFKGLFGVATFPLVFDGITKVLSHNSNSQFAASGEGVRLESPRFRENWSVYSTSQIGARLALETDIMNNLLYLKEKVNKNISLSFVGNKVFFAIEQDKFLEPDYRLSIDNQKSVKTINEELSVIQNIIQTLKLSQNNQISKK